MAGNGEFIEFLSESALKDLRNGNAELVSMISNVEKVGLAMQKIKMPSASDGAVKNLNAEYTKQEKIIQNLQVKLDKQASIQQANIEKQRLAEIRLQQQREKSFDAREKQVNRETAQITKISGLYNQTQKAVNDVTAVYNNLAIKKALGNQLSAKEEIQLVKLTKDLNIYQSALKKVDADIQKNGRSVGDYTSHWNGLGNSINQLTREAPAFAVSMNTGFLALSNNLPILFDEINKITTANKELLKTGKPVQSAFAQIAGALFSWQTALSVGVTLLTLYGGKIIDSISGSAKRKEALEAEKKAVEDKVEAERQQNEAIGQSIASEQNRARILFEIARNTEVSDKKRKEALDEIRGSYSKYLGDLTNQQILAGETADAEERLNKALIGRGYALATQNLLEQNLTKQMEAQVAYEKEIAKLGILNTRERALNADGSIKNIKEYNKWIRDSSKGMQNATNTLNEKLEPLKEEEGLLLSLFRGNAKYLDVIDKITKGKQKKVAVDKEEAQVQQNSKIAFETNISVLEKQLDGIDRTSTAYDTLNGLLQLQKEIYDQLFGSKKENEIVDDALIKKAGKLALALKEIEKAGQSINKGFEEGQNKINDYLKTFSSEVFDSAGLGTLFEILNKEIFGFGENFGVTFNAIAESAQEAFNIIGEASNANFENEYANLEKQRDVAILFAGESASAKDEIGRQYEREQRKIRQREAKAQKDLALFNIAINTAQGIVSALASTPPNVPLSIAIGAIGLLQGALVAGKEIPKYFKGTENHSGGAMIVNDAKGSNFREAVQTPDGKITIPNGRNVLMNAPKGTKVFTAERTASMFDANLNRMLSNNGIVMSNSGMDTSGIENGISGLTSVVRNKKETIINFDKNGFGMYVQDGNTRKQNMNNRVTGNGKSV